MRSRDELKLKSIDPAERLRAFALDERHQGAFERISELLKPHARELARTYMEQFLQNAGIELDEAAKEAQIEKTAEYSAAKYTPPIDAAWIARIEKMGWLQYRLGTPTHANLGAISRSQRRSAEIIFEGARDVEEGRYLVEQFMRIAALEVEIQSSTVSGYKEAEARLNRKEQIAGFRSDVASVVEAATSQSADIKAQADEVNAATAVLLDKAAEVAAAAEQSAIAMKSAASTSSGLVQSIETTRGAVKTASGVAADASEKAETSARIASQFAEHARDIDSIVTLIRTIAKQTNLLALNATIEAARAGDAGRGFAVVASEVKSLAGQTARAIDEIEMKIASIQDSSSEAVDSNAGIVEVIRGISSAATEVEGAMNEQSATVTLITSSIDETAISAEAVSEAIAEIRATAERLASELSETAAGAGALDNRLSEVEEGAAKFLAKLDA